MALILKGVFHLIKSPGSDSAERSRDALCLSERTYLYIFFVFVKSDRFVEDFPKKICSSRNSTKALEAELWRQILLLIQMFEGSVTVNSLHKDIFTREISYVLPRKNLFPQVGLTDILNTSMALQGRAQHSTYINIL